MNSNEYDPQQALLRSAYVAITLLGAILLTGAWLQSFDNIIWWLVLATVLVVAVGSVLIGHQAGSTNNKSLVPSTKDKQLSRFFQALPVAGGICLIGFVLFVAVALDGFQDILLLLALIASILFFFLVNIAYLRQRS